MVSSAKPKTFTIWLFTKESIPFYWHENWSTPARDHHLGAMWPGPIHECVHALAPSSVKWRSGVLKRYNWNSTWCPLRSPYPLRLKQHCFKFNVMSWQSPMSSSTFPEPCILLVLLVSNSSSFPTVISLISPILSWSFCSVPTRTL